LARNQNLLLAAESVRKVIGPDMSFCQDSPGSPQGIDFVRMNQVTDFVIIREGQHLREDSDFRDNWTRAKAAGLPWPSILAPGAYAFW
jgi:hypothetical protein